MSRRSTECNISVSRPRTNPRKARCGLRDDTGLPALPKPTWANQRPLRAAHVHACRRGSFPFRPARKAPTSQGITSLNLPQSQDGLRTTLACWAPAGWAWTSRERSKHVHGVWPTI